jgi:hypothetical protein
MTMRRIVSVYLPMWPIDRLRPIKLPKSKWQKHVKVIKDKKVIEREVVGPIKHIAKRRAEISKLRANRLAEIKERLADRILARVNQTLKLVK